MKKFLNTLPNKKLIILSALMFVLVVIQFLYSMQFSKYSNRSSEMGWWFATRISFSPHHLITVLIPEFFGTPLDYSYLSTSNFWNLCIYIGVLPLILILFTFLTKRDKITIPLFILAAFSLLFSMGQYTPIYYFFYKYIPFFDFFRGPSRFLYFYILSASLLSGIGFKELSKIKENKTFKHLLIILFVVSILVTALIALNETFIKMFLEDQISKTLESYVEAGSSWLQPLSFYTEKIEGVFNYMLYGSIIFSALVGLSSLVLILFPKRPKTMTIIIIALIVIDLWAFGFRYMNFAPIEEIFGRADIVNFLLNDTSDYRAMVLNEDLLLPHIASKYDIQLAEGSTGIQLKSFKMFLDRIGNRSSEEYVSPMITQIHNETLVNFLGVKYILSVEELENYTLVYNSSNPPGLIYENYNYMPKAFFVVCEGNIEIIEDLSNSMLLHVENEQPCTFVLSEVWYPGWKAYDNGQEIEIYKFEDTLKSLELDAGDHMIEFVYNPLSGLI